jgi:uncharacterized protein (TIGR00304 family)
MRRATGIVISTLAGGAAVVGIAVASGAARVALVVFVPVIYGSSLLLGVGIALLIAGFLALPFAFAAPPDASSVAGEEPLLPASAVRSGGLVLIGPVPIVWGSWSRMPARTRAILAALGAAVLAIAVVVWVIAVG